MALRLFCYHCKTTDVCISAVERHICILTLAAIATAAFRDAHEIAAELLPGSHPIRLSVEVEYVAYIYDCLHEADQSRRRAKAAVRAVYEAQEGMDDESFVDASELVSM